MVPRVLTHSHMSLIFDAQPLIERFKQRLLDFLNFSFVISLSKGLDEVFGLDCL